MCHFLAKPLNFLSAPLFPPLCLSLGLKNGGDLDSFFTWNVLPGLSEIWASVLCCSYWEDIIRRNSLFFVSIQLVRGASKKVYISMENVSCYFQFLAWTLSKKVVQFVGVKILPLSARKWRRFFSAKCLLACNFSCMLSVYRTLQDGVV